MRRLRLVVLLVVAGFVAQSGSAMRAPARGEARAGWQPATRLFSGADPAAIPGVSGPVVAVDGSGRATALWLDGSSSDGSSSGQVVMEADSNPTGSWTLVRTLSAFGTDVSSLPSLAVDARGDAVVAWANRVGATYQVHASYRTAGGDWQPPRTLPLRGPQVGIDDSGRALVAGVGARGVEVVSRGRSGGWGAPKVICRCSDASLDSFAVNARGSALVAWDRLRRPGGLWDRTRSPAGRWSKLQEIDSAGYLADVALNSRGDAVVAYLHGSAEFREGELAVAIRPPNGRFGRPQTLGSDAYWGFMPALAPTGEAVLMWHPGGCCLFAMSRRPGASSFSSRQTLDTSPDYGDAEPHALAVDANGNTFALWLRTAAGLGYGELYLHAAQRPAGGSFDSGSDIGEIGDDSYKHSACQGYAALASTPDGHAVAVWLVRTADPGRCTAIDAATFTP